MDGELKKTRRKRRGPGTDKPVRKIFSLRLEQSTFERMNRMLGGYQGSRNDYIEQLIEMDLAYRDRISARCRPSSADEFD